MTAYQYACYISYSEFNYKEYQKLLLIEQQMSRRIVPSIPSRIQAPEFLRESFFIRWLSKALIGGQK